MPIRLLRYIVISILATILPSQAMASLLQTETSSSRQTIQTSTSVNTNEAFGQCGQKESTQCSPDDTKTRVQDNSSALEGVGIGRWSSSARTQTDHTPPINPDIVTPAVPAQHKNHLSSANINQEFNSAHRLSGWKETNAHYVALNSQYS
ncbi:hypothetical protein L4C34_14795 [Vibrio profundum]|uniref:hypothetical protein n=1 Tax=Vibrio profundum TaxID=2910247 RepID=UPI003D0EAE04